MTAMLEPSTSIPSCLRSAEGHPVPLLGVSLTGAVYGAQARVVLRQRYRNVEAKPIEAVYTFPVPSDAVLAGFAMECAGRRLEGEVKEREEAFLAYDEALSKGHGAALLEEERRNVFTASVGNLLPGEETIIEVAYVQRLAADEGALRLMIPTLVAPRYVPGAPAGDRSGHGFSGPTDRVPDADRITPRIGDVDYGLELDLVFDLGRDVSIESPSHAITVTAGEGGRRRVQLKSANVPLDRDLVLLASGAPGVAAGVVADKRAGAEGTFALTVVPDLFDPSRRAGAHDVVFVVDVSGSMDGESIEQARTAMRLCLRHLAEGDRFGIIAFSNRFESFQSALVPFTQKTLSQADAFVAGLVANGGTEMLEPLLAAASQLADARRDRLVVLLTDGQVGNEAEIVERVLEKAAGSIRFYTFGIGTNVSDLLVRDLARRTRAAAELIHPGERIDEKVTAQFARATAARVDELSLRLVGVDGGELAPAELPPLVDGEPWVVYGRYEEPGAGHAELRGTLRGEAFFLRVPVELSTEAARPGLAALWAGARIRDLEEGEAKLEGRRLDAQKKRIVALSVEHGVASKHASFVVIEKRTGERRAKGQPEARPVPVHGPAGWAMLEGSRERAFAGGMRVLAAMAPPGMARAVMAPMSVARPAAPTGAPPSRAPYAGPPPMPRAPAPPAKAGLGGMIARAAGRVRDVVAKDEGFDATRAAPMAQPDLGLAEIAPQGPATGDPLAALFERQLASGLWEGADASDGARLRATAATLLACHRAGIDTAHPIYGAQIKKAIEAVLRVAAELAGRGDGEGAIAPGIVAAFLVAAGRRVRAQVLSAVRASPLPAVRSLEPSLASPEVALAKLAALGL
jgi:Ca-activated chloride channel family protein